MSENNIQQRLKRSSPLTLSPHKKRAALIPLSEFNAPRLEEKHREESVKTVSHAIIPSPQRYYRIRYVKCFNMAFEVL